MRDTKGSYFKRPVMSEETYLTTRLKGMGKVEKKWYTNAMKTWMKEDYNHYTQFHLRMVGEEELSKKS